MILDASGLMHNEAKGPKGVTLPSKKSFAGVVSPEKGNREQFKKHINRNESLSGKSEESDSLLASSAVSTKAQDAHRGKTPDSQSKIPSWEARKTSEDEHALHFNEIQESESQDEYALMLERPHSYEATKIPCDRSIELMDASGYRVDLDKPEDGLGLIHPNLLIQSSSRYDLFKESDNNTIIQDDGSFSREDRYVFMDITPLQTQKEKEFFEALHPPDASKEIESEVSLEPKKKASIVLNPLGKDKVQVSDIPSPLNEGRPTLIWTHTETIQKPPLNAEQLIALHTLGQRQEMSVSTPLKSGIDFLETLSLDRSALKMPLIDDKRIEAEVHTEAIQEMYDQDGGGVSMDTNLREMIASIAISPKQGERAHIILTDKDSAAMPKMMDVFTFPQTKGMDVMLSQEMSGSIPPLRQVTMHLSKAFETKVDHFSLQLDPEHLGKVEIELKIVNNTHMQAVFHLDNPEAYDLLRKDSAELQSILRESGFESSLDDFSFTYKDPGQGQSEEQNSAKALPSKFPNQKIEDFSDQSLHRDSQFQVGWRSDPTKTLDTVI